MESLARNDDESFRLVSLDFMLQFLLKKCKVVHECLLAVKFKLRVPKLNIFCKILYSNNNFKLYKVVSENSYFWTRYVLIERNRMLMLGTLGSLLRIYFQVTKFVFKCYIYRTVNYIYIYIVKFLKKQIKVK